MRHFDPVSTFPQCCRRKLDFSTPVKAREHCILKHLQNMADRRARTSAAQFEQGQVITITIGQATIRHYHYLKVNSQPDAFASGDHLRWMEIETQ
jgi:hypothetical protein